MARFAAEFEVSATATEAYAVLCDPLRRPEWDPSVRSVTPVVPASGVIGDRYDVTVGFYGKAVEATYEIAELEEDRRIVLITHGKVRGRDVIEITPTGSGARVSLDLTAELKGMARILDGGLQVAFAGIGENAVAGVRGRLG